MTVIDCRLQNSVEEISRVLCTKITKRSISGLDILYH